MELGKAGRSCIRWAMLFLVVCGTIASGDEYDDRRTSPSCAAAGLTAA
jgi:hypothetical protein